jgi:ATP-dependent Clp protease ATP-binding subunit ClpA
MVEAVVSKIAKVPPKSVSKDDGSKLLTIKEDIKKSIFGQDDAIDKLVMATKRARAGFRKGKKPIANLVFAGKTGTGKTALCQQFADMMGTQLIRWDMSEMTEKNSVSKWIGTSAGYIGYEEGGRLVDQIRKTPNCVLLLDEIEKASSDVFNVLLGIMDNAKLSDSHGQTADFTNVVLVMTSNVGANRIGEKTIGFDEKSTRGKTNIDAITQEYDKMFSPEFRNRVDTLVIFNDLTDEDLKRIVGREVEDFKVQLKDKNIDIELDEGSIDWLVKNGYDEKMGARPLVRLFEKEIKDKLVDTVLFGDLKSGGKASFYVDNDILSFNTEKIESVEEKETEKVK